MKEFINEPLSRHTTFHIGGPVDRMVIPESEEELVNFVRECVRNKVKFYVIGRGSNILARDSRIRGVVIKNTQACCDISLEGNKVTAGSSTTLQKLIEFCVANNLYGMEYLYSVPGNVGGAISMNAGRGARFKDHISDYLEYVRVFDGNSIRHIKKESCNFDYRDSIFRRDGGLVILSAVFNFPFQEENKGLAKIKERMDFVNKTQDYEYPCAGSIFKSNFKALPELWGLRIGGAEFSEKTGNWINNVNGATFEDVSGLISYAQDCHKVRGLPIPELELVILD